jgi:hypothetical protein
VARQATPPLIEPCAKLRGDRGQVYRRERFGLVELRQARRERALALLARLHLRHERIERPAHRDRLRQPGEFLVDLFQIALRLHPPGGRIVGPESPERFGDRAGDDFGP